MNIRTPSRQQGVALVVSLIILVSLTMLGLTAIQRTTTDLAMAGNQRESGLMFQAAEVGLVAAEAAIVASNSNGDFSNTTAHNNQGLFEVESDNASYPHPSYFDDNAWTTQSTQASTTLNVHEQPRYMIEYLGDRKQNQFGGISIGGYGGGAAGGDVSIYRTTSRGVGLTGNSYRYVQSYFGKVAP